MQNSSLPFADERKERHTAIIRQPLKIFFARVLSFCIVTALSVRNEGKSKSYERLWNRPIDADL